MKTAWGNEHGLKFQLMFPAADEFQPLFCARKEIMCNFAGVNHLLYGKEERNDPG